MKCRAVIRKLSAYHDHELPETEASLIAGHIQSCDTCRQELDLIKSGDASLKSMGKMSVSQGFRAHLWQSIRAGQRSLKQDRSIWDIYIRRFIPVPLIGAALILLFSVVTVLAPLAHASAAGTARKDVIAALTCFSGKRVFGPLNFMVFCDTCHDMLCTSCTSGVNGSCPHCALEGVRK